ncbi:MAG: hypothetical protein AAGF31_02720 [Planctomycetota bacterium]
MIRVVCPNCGKGVKAPDSYAGREICCPECGRQMSLGGSASSAAKLEGEQSHSGPPPFSQQDATPNPPPFVLKPPLPPDQSYPIPRAVAAQQRPISGWGAASFLIGMTAVALLGVSFALGVLSVVKLRLSSEEASWELAVLMTTAFPICLAGFVSGWIGLMQPDRRQLLSCMGMLLNGLVIAPLLIFIVVEFASRIELHRITNTRASPSAPADVNVSRSDRNVRPGSQPYSQPTNVSP